MNRPKQSESKTLAEYAREAGAAAEPMEIGGKPADVCPYCGAAMFSHRTQKLSTRIIRYVTCRNPKCGKRFVSRQEPAVLVREVGEDS